MNTEKIVNEKRQPALKVAEVSSRFTSLVKDKESILFALAFLLDYGGHVYYDEDTDPDIIELEQFLTENNIRYEKTQRNRKAICTIF